MRNLLSPSHLYEGVGILATPFGSIISLNDVYKTKEFDANNPPEPICDTSYDLAPKGTFEDWFNMYLNEVKGHFIWN